MYYFSDTYEQGRAKFLAVCKANELAIETHINPCGKSQNGEDLAMDVVWCGAPKAQKVFLVTCGTHGLEAATGSATILQWLHEKKHLTLAPDCAVLIIHAVNAYGWAYDSRTNENNIDLNRNFLNHNASYPQNKNYPELIKRLQIDEINSESLKIALDCFYDFVQEKGMNQAIQAITAGQYEDAGGIGYGGHQDSWSKQTLIEIIKTKLQDANKIVCIDWHTGIGKYGEPFFISQDKVGSTKYNMASQWWQTAIHSDDIFDEGVSPQYSGLLIQGVKDALQKNNEVDILSVAIEIGTYDIDSMLQALIIDNWLRQNSQKSQSSEAMRQRLRLVERFYPSMPEWRASVLKHAKIIYQQTLHGLSNW